MENVKVSVVIPVYNVEKYIERCIRSLMAQDYVNIEIIAVNDGSQDSSAAILDYMTLEDERIKVIHKENGGVSSARNAGIEAAMGEWITFVDGDDWVEPNYVSYFLHLVEGAGCDIAMNKNNFSEHNSVSSDRTYVVTAEKAMEWIYLETIFVAVWNKIYKTSFLKKHDIFFDESIWFGEGMLFNIDCLQYTDYVAIGEKNVYHQVSNPNSAMRKFDLRSQHCGIRSLEIQKKNWKKKNKRIEDAWNYHRRAFYWSIMSGLATCHMENEHREEFEECARNLRKNLWTSLKVQIPIKQKIIYVCLAINPYYIVNRKRKVR